LAIFCPVQLQAEETSAQSGCDSWLDVVYKFIGINCPSDKITVVRGQTEQASGSALVELSPSTGAERTLWNCTECRSPVRFRKGIAVVTPAGISLVDATGSHGLITAPNIVRILAAPADSKDELLVVASTADNHLSIATADVARNELRKRVDVPPGEGLPPLIPNQIRADGAVIEAHTEAGRAPLMRRGKGGKQSVSPALDRKHDLYFRIDPIWLPGGKVGYVKKKV